MRPALLSALAAICSAASLTGQQQRAISDSDLFAFRWVASPQISPDGRQAAYVLVTVDAKHAGYETSLWLVATDGAPGDVRPVRGGVVAMGPRRGAHLLRLRSQAAVVLLTPRQQRVLRPGRGHRQRHGHGRGPPRSGVRSGARPRREGGRVPGL